MDPVSITIAALSLVVAAISLGVAIYAARTARSQGGRQLMLGQAAGNRDSSTLALSYAGWELQAQQYIDSAWRDFDIIALKQNDEDKDSEILRRLLVSARQRVLNAYDAACQAYLDKKIDRERFRRAQQRNIFRLFDDLETYPELRDRNTDYRALATVYEEWRGQP